MTKRGFLTLMAAAALTLAVLVGAWSYSMAEVASEGQLKITTMSEALVGVEPPAVGVTRLTPVAANLTVHNRSANDLSVTYTASPVVAGLTVTGVAIACPGGTDGTIVLTVSAAAGVPVAVYNVGSWIQAFSGGFTAKVDFDVTVEVLNAPPVAVADAITVTKNTSFKFFPLAANPTTPDSDSDGGTLAVTAVGTPTKGTAVVDSSDNSVTYTAPNEVGTATFTYTISDGQGGAAGGVVTVTIQ